MEKARVTQRAAEGSLRCPYCRAAVDESVRPCTGCGATLHRECWLELGRCPTMGCRVVPIDRSSGQTESEPRPVTDELWPEAYVVVLTLVVVTAVLFGVALSSELEAAFKVIPREALILATIALYYGLFKLLAPRRSEPPAPAPPPPPTADRDEARPLERPATVEDAEARASPSSRRARSIARWVFAALAPAAGLAALLSQEAIARAVPADLVVAALLGYWGLLWAVVYSKKGAR